MLRATLCFGAVYSVLLLCIGSALPQVPPLDPDTECSYPSLIDATADQLQAGLEQGCFSSVDLVKAYLGRIGEVNSKLHAVSELNPDALDIARQLDLERGEGRVRGPLHGLPVLVKGNIGTADKMNPGAGSTALRGAEYPEDSTVVAKLRDAGVVLLGLAGLSQWANFRSTNSSNGWSAIGGQVMGAYVDMQDPSGSSSGSGVASDLGLAWATLGTETSGSIISPSQFNNIVGIKPTVGLTSRHLVVPISQHQDTVGPMARTVRDAAKLLSAIAGKDPKDNYTSAIPFDTIPDYAAACTTDSNSISLLQGKRLGIPRNFINRYNQGLGAPPLASFDAAISTLSGAGAVIIDNANFPSFDDFDYQGDALSVVFADFLNDIASFFAQLKTNPNNLTSLSDLRAFTQTSAVVEEEEFPDRNTGIWDAALAAGFTNTDPSFFPLHSSLISFAGEGYIRGALKTHNLDALILPSDISPFIPAILGSPVITVPMGAWPEGTPVIFEPRGELVVRAPGMPVGLSFLGDLWSEEGLVGIACGFEGVSGERGKKLGRVVQPGMELVDVL